MKRKLLLLFFLFFLGLSVILLVWGFWPPRRETVTAPLVLPAEMLSLPETRTIQLTFSPEMRAGDAQIVELALVVDEEAHESSAYEEYMVFAEARLDLPLANVRPADMTSTALVEGRGATFYWDVSPRGEDALRGTAWLFLRFVPKAGGEERRQPVSAQLVEIHSKSVLGWAGSEARVGGLVSLVIGLALSVPLARVRRISL